MSCSEALDYVLDWRRPSYSSSTMATTCPNGDLANLTALDAMLTARAAPLPSGEMAITILILGWTNGKSQISMRETGASYIEAQIARLKSFGLENYLVISTDLSAAQEYKKKTSAAKSVSGNLCKGVLRPRGICCGWSGQGIEQLSTSSWGLFPTHPYLLFLQRWWFTTHALSRGYSILSLSTPTSIFRSTRTG